MGVNFNLIKNTATWQKRGSVKSVAVNLANGLGAVRIYVYYCVFIQRGNLY